MKQRSDCNRRTAPAQLAAAFARFAATFAALLIGAGAVVSGPGPDGQAPRGEFGGTLDGRLIYERACASCHDEGFNGAPRSDRRADSRVGRRSRGCTRHGRDPVQFEVSFGVCPEK